MKLSVGNYLIVNSQFFDNFFSNIEKNFKNFEK